MGFQTAITRTLKIAHPIFQAPMAGGGDTPELVAAVCNAGGMGFIGAAYLNPEQIMATAQAVRARTAQPFGINLFAPVQSMGSGNAKKALASVAPYFAELGLAAPEMPKQFGSSFEEQLSAALQTGAAALSFTFGELPPSAMHAIKARGMFAIGTATTVKEAMTLEKCGVDAVVAQGSEAGGHRGTFHGDFNGAMVGSISLVPQMVDAVRIPVIASGGIMDGRGIVAALALGASAVQMGTAFLTCDEAGVSDAYKTAILSAHEDQTRITRAFSGRPARGIVNRFMTEVEQAGEGAILPFPLQNVLTRSLRAEAGKRGQAELLSLWSGQAPRLARRQSAAELVARLVKEIETTIAGLQNPAS
jgi:nitronate monooxygenase